MKDEYPLTPDANLQSSHQDTVTHDLVDDTESQKKPSFRDIPAPIFIEDEARHDLNLSEEEQLLCIIDRHPIGRLTFYFSGIVGALATLGFLYYITYHKSDLGLSGIPDIIIGLLGILIIVVITVVNYINLRLYNLNKLILTTECVLVENQQGLFNRHRKTLNLESIEDVSYDQKGIFSQLLGYATLKISTVGKDSVIFTLAQDAKRHAEYIENAREQLLKKQRLEERGGIVVGSENQTGN